VMAEGGARKDDLVDAYLRHLLKGEAPPSSSDVDPADRRVVDCTFRILDAIAGMPEELVPELHEDPVAQALGFVQASDDSAKVDEVGSDAWGERIARAISANGGSLTLPPGVERGDVAGRASFLVRMQGARLRVQVVEPEQLRATPELLTKSERLFYEFPETSAVAWIARDEEMTTQVIEPVDCYPAIEIPSGARRPPRPRRPALMLSLAIGRYREEAAAMWEPSLSIATRIEEGTPIEVVAHEVSTRAIARLAQEGTKARTKAKRDTWIPLGKEEADAIARVVRDVHRGILDTEDIASFLDEATEAVA
jgi:hypothetical protein